MRTEFHLSFWWQFDCDARHAVRSCVSQYETVFSDPDLRFRGRIRQCLDARRWPHLPDTVAPAAHAAP